MLLNLKAETCQTLDLQPAAVANFRVSSRMILPDPEAIAAEIRAALVQHVASTWFPRCIDPEGGYHENFSDDWTPLKDHTRSLVFQSRMLWFTSEMSAIDQTFVPFREHGTEYVTRRLMGQDGILKMTFRPDGTDLTKQRSSYGLAFALFALSNALRFSDEPKTRLAVESTFSYLESFHKDPEGRGYFEHTNLDGTLAPDPERGETLDALFKHQNPHLHLLEALTNLVRVWSNPLVRIRLKEIVDLFVNYLFTHPGYLADHVSSKGIGGNGRVNFGHDVEVAHLLIAACDVLKEDQDLILGIACNLVDHALEHGWDHEAGGFWSGRTANLEVEFRKVWWVQMEGLIALATLWARTGKETYLKALGNQWEWIQNHQIDRINRGLIHTLDSKGDRTGFLGKGNTWKAAYHDGRALLHVPTILQNVSRQ